MDFSFSKGQRIIVELSSNEIFEGDYVSGTENRIDMINVTESPKGNKMKGMLSYYRMEIATVRLLNETNGISNCQQETKPEEQQQVNVIAMSRTEYERLEEMTRNYIYMATMDKRYVDAADHLHNCESVGVIGIGSESGRVKPISLLVLCSWDQVYLFDLTLFHHKTFPPELKGLLESSFIKKVVHDARAIADCLYHCHKVNITNVFDTQVADVMLLTEEIGRPPKQCRTLSNCLTHYLNLPASFLESADNVSPEVWDKRPLDSTRKIVAALNVTYLIPLKYKLQELMMKNFNAAVAARMDSVKNANAYNAHMNVHSNTVSADIEDLLNSKIKEL